MRNIENLVFKGGGVMGTAYAGAMEALDEYNLLDSVQRVAGTSSGSITAALVSLRYTSAQIKDITHSIDFRKFGDHWDPLRILTSYGIYKGDAFLSWMRNIIKQRTGNENLTYAELAGQGYRELKVFATDLNTASIREFSNESTPHVVVAESLRASMAVPFFFSAWKFPNDNPDNHIYIDGGTVYNYPITCFGDLSKTLGFFLFNNVKDVSDLDYDEILKYTKSLFRAMSNAQDQDFTRDADEGAVSVKIDDFGISSLDLDISEEDKERLFKSGKTSTIDYLKRSASSD